MDELDVIVCACGHEFTYVCVCGITRSQRLHGFTAQDILDRERRG